MGFSQAFSSETTPYEPLVSPAPPTPIPSPVYPDVLKVSGVALSEINEDYHIFTDDGSGGGGGKLYRKKNSDSVTKSKRHYQLFVSVNDEDSVALIEHWGKEENDWVTDYTFHPHTNGGWKCIDPPR